MYTKTISAVEYYNCILNVLLLEFEVFNPDILIRNAVREAVADFCRSERGKLVLKSTGGNFNWGDIATYLTNDICQKHGFRLIRTTNCEAVNLNESLFEEE